MKKKEITVETPTVENKIETPVKTRKEYLLELYKILQEEGIRSISDLENLIARA